MPRAAAVVGGHRVADRAIAVAALGASREGDPHGIARGRPGAAARRCDAHTAAATTGCEGLARGQEREGAVAVAALGDGEGLARDLERAGACYTIIGCDRIVHRAAARTTVVRSDGDKARIARRCPRATALRRYTHAARAAISSE